jgi:hypothetical protein
MVTYRDIKNAGFSQLFQAETPGWCVCSFCYKQIHRGSLYRRKDDRLFHEGCAADSIAVEKAEQEMA